MQSPQQDAERMTTASSILPAETTVQSLLDLTLQTLDDAKAEEITTIDLSGKSSIADFMVVASGRSHRHVGAVAERLARDLKDKGFGRIRQEGKDNCDWVLIDAGAVIVHIFRPEVREFYNIEKMWMAERPEDIEDV